MRYLLTIMMALFLASCTSTRKVFVSQKEYIVTGIVQKIAGKCVVETIKKGGTGQKLYFTSDCTDNIGDVYQITKH